MAYPKLLVVEDDKNDLEQLLAVLREGDFEVNIATRGEDAKRMLQQGEYDSVLLNLTLPDMDGLELLRWCQERWPGMPVQIISGHYEMETKMKSFQAGACYFWQKPYESVANLAIIKMLQIKRLAFEQGRAKSNPRTSLGGVVTGSGIAAVASAFYLGNELGWLSHEVSNILKFVGVIMAVFGPMYHGVAAQDKQK